MVNKQQFYLRLAFLGICALVLVCMTVLVMCGHNGGITNTLLGVSAALFGVNLWSVVNGKADPAAPGSGGSGTGDPGSG